MLHLAGAAAALAYVVSPAGPSFVRTNAAKIPGVKTFGAAAVIGLAALAANKFVKPNKWLKLLGTAGIVLAAVQVGSKGADFKWLGDHDTGDLDDVDVDDIDDVDDLDDVDDVDDVDGED